MTDYTNGLGADTNVDVDDTMGGVQSSATSTTPSGVPGPADQAGVSSDTGPRSMEPEEDVSLRDELEGAPAPVADGLPTSVNGDRNADTAE
ncbi:hypothetical protein [Deinococcus maricopensis]|nr:hypothetical protein [Deinococcus maricopensis]